MRRLILVLLVITLPAAAQTRRDYDAQGRYQGRAESRGDTTRFYDAQGRYQGRSERR